MPPPTLVLASASPARLRLLRDAGLTPLVVVSGVDESAVRASTAATMVAELAARKAHTVAVAHPTAIVLGCDSLLAFDGEIFGKPRDPAEALSRWRRMRGGTGQLLTGHCLVANGVTVEATCSTTVRFGRPSDAELAAYVATGESVNVAGGFTLDGRSAPFIAGVEGDPGNVIGLSLPVLRDLLARLDVGITELWS